MKKYKPGDKFIIEISHIEEDDCLNSPLYFIKGFKGLNFQDFALDQFQRLNPVDNYRDDVDDMIGLEIGDAVDIKGETYYYNGYYGYVYSEVGYYYCFVKDKANINTPEERKDLYEPNNDLIIDSRELDGKLKSYEAKLYGLFKKKIESLKNDPIKLATYVCGVLMDNDDHNPDAVYCTECALYEICHSDKNKIPMYNLADWLLDKENK